MEFLGEISAADLDHAIALVLAVVLGAVIGLERQLRRHPAGLHTNALVTLGSAAFVVAGSLLGDPGGMARVAGQVITGVGFLCAGVLHHGPPGRGINTTATAWSAAGAAGGGGLTGRFGACFVAALVALPHLPNTLPRPRASHRAAGRRPLGGVGGNRRVLPCAFVMRI